MVRPVRLLTLVLAAALAGPLVWAVPGAASAERATGPSGHPVPRFVSLRSSKVNLRAGPGTDHEVLWTYVRRSLPVEIIEEYETWRRIRDAEGTQGWVHQGLLDGKRMVLIREGAGEQMLFSNPEAEARSVARVEPGVLAQLRDCEGPWCRITAGGYTGWMRRGSLWGIYPDEELD
jgi:SH3-like domain-containing protein